jgi:predicted MFS family arabinose efflux permease
LDEEKANLSFHILGVSSLWQEIWQSISMVSAPELLAQMGVFFFSAVYSTYINGPFTAFFKDDRMQVGGIFAVNGVGKILFTYLGGKLKDRLSSQGFLKILTGIMAALMIVYFALQFMQDEIMDADRTTRYAIFYVIGFFAAFDGVLNIYLYAYLGKLYPKGVVSIQAIAVFKFIQSMSSALAFFYARFLNGMVQVIIMIVVLGATFPIAIKFNKDKGKIS